MKAFVRMFMDLVGIFNDEQNFPDEGKMPPGGWSCCQSVELIFVVGVSFGMMFGNSSEAHEEWSTDEDEDADEEYDSDAGEQGTLWEPMARNHIYMNLKEEVSKAREFLKSEEFERGMDEIEVKRKQKNAKKRAEKRRKQKEKRIREAALKAEEDERLRLAEEQSRKEQEEIARRRKEELRCRAFDDVP